MKRVLLPILVLGGGIGIFMFLMATRPKPKQKPRKDPTVLVEAKVVRPSTQRLSVRATGTVIPAQEIALASEISARVQFVNERMAPGAVFKKNELLVRLDARDFRLAADQQRATVDKARTELRIERSRKEVAEREWKLFGKGEGAPSEDGNLALREPQLRSARAALSAAESSLERAQLAVSKAGLRAPFNAMVRTESVDVGQMVAPTQPLMTLVGTDAFWVQVSIPLDELPRIQVPGADGKGTGSTVRVTQNIGRQSVVREGRVVRLLGDVDPQGRMARVLVEVADPLGLAATKGELPLLLGAFVEVSLEGGEEQGVFVLPRRALRDGNTVFVVSKETTLEIKEVQVVWGTPKEVFVRGLTDGDNVIVSPVPAPSPGMKLRTAVTPAKSTKKAEAKGKAEAPPEKPL